MRRCSAAVRWLICQLQCGRLRGIADRLHRWIISSENALCGIDFAEIAAAAFPPEEFDAISTFPQVVNRPGVAVARVSRMHNDFWIGAIELPCAADRNRLASTNTETKAVIGMDAKGVIAFLGDDHVRDVEVLPYDEAFGYLGLRVVRQTAREPYNLGISVDWQASGFLGIATVRNNSPAEDAGLQPGDEIVELGRKNVTRENWLLSLSRYKEGDRIPVTVRRDRQTIKTTVIVGAPERFEYRIEEQKDATPQQKVLREAWLKGTP